MILRYYIGGWKLGEPKTIFIQDGDFNIPSRQYTSINGLIVDFPNVDPSINLYTTNANTKNWLLDFGFTNVNIIDEVFPYGFSEDWYFSETTVLEVRRGASSIQVSFNFRIGDTLYNLITIGNNLNTRSFPFSEPRADGNYNCYDLIPASNHVDVVTNGFGGPHWGDFLKGVEPLVPDPFGPGGTSEPGGGGGTFDDESDEIPDSSLPTLSAANTGFTRIYNPTLSQVQAMANYLWTDDTVIETIWNHIKQFLEDPMDAFIAFNLVPCVVPNGGTSNFKVMYIDTGVTMTTAANQFVDVDCGTVQLDRYYGSALDYTPYTRVGCFLPYIGTVELDTDEVMGATLQVKYRIDIVSGACVAKIFVDGTCLYQYSGHCAINIPFTSADFSNYVNAIIQVAKAGLIAASGVPITSAGAGEAAEQLTGRTVTTTRVTLRNPATGRQNVAGTKTTEREIYSTEASFKGLSPSNLANTVGAVMGSKPMIEHSGGFNGNSGYLGIRRPFLIIKRPRMCNPSGYGALNGYPCMIKETLGNLSGYTQVQQVQLTGLSATNPEQAEILQLLKQGVIL